MLLLLLIIIREYDYIYLSMIMPPTPYDDNPLWGCHLALAEYTEAGEWAQLLRTINEGDHRGATTT